MKRRFLLPGMLVLGPLLAAPPTPDGWAEWAQWAEKVQPVTDAQGHGPDIGSDEWATALARKLGVVDAEGHGPDLKSAEWRAAVERKLRLVEQRELLSSHDTEARFEGITGQLCMGRTALCPDRCGHSGRVAGFGIVRYLAYRKPGKYGDPKQERFQVLIEDNAGQSRVPAAIHAAILGLEPGDLVRLKWNHDYVTRDGSKSPERPVLLVEPLGKP